ncbi:DUF6734 family protein [Paraburkholderia sp. MM5384-R2]|uniref:DUF6734 family protein n=1 Tax=Paraburkholderia sp. MM5384-R2 TaxID=2723097 RepID=UPI001618A547|nr:DUF6734 family protein [Paraburkholderia sp. MM5384-R2]MBB5503102.1 hypothetical protein [Paraburkholderia sp. MM5384-R2]
MRAVWSFWSKPFTAHKGKSWCAPHHHLLAWGLSLRLARKHYPETVLVTDRAGKTLLIDQLGLEFGEVSTELEALRDVEEGWWALGKLYAYSLQERPFIHIDADVFLWKPLPPAVVNAPVFAQCPEYHPPLDLYAAPSDIETAFARHGLSLPVEWEWSRSLGEPSFREENCGIVGGQHVDFLRYFATLGLKLVRDPANAAAWHELPDKDGYNMRVEQLLLSVCLDYHRFHPDSPYRGVHVRHLFPSWADAFNPARAAQAGYTHLLGSSKSDANVARRLERRMQSEDLDFYRLCVQLGQRLTRT